jgi:uncharacterized damage-inducible protein DinB
MLQPLALIFKLNNNLIARSLDGLSDEDVWRQPSGSGNPIGWILGHLTETRAGLLSDMGMPFDCGWSRAFQRGSALQDRAGYPARAAIEAAWKATHPAMRDAFGTISDDRLVAPASRRPVPGIESLAALIAFCGFHESYHVGQIGLIRKQLGHSSIAG